MLANKGFVEKAPKEKIQEEYDISNIKYIIFLNSGILVLLILMKRD